MALAKRQDGYCYDRFGNVYPCNSAWYDWGRWVTLIIVVIAIVLLFCAFSCISSRRRRRRGLNPYNGTGWAGRAPWGHGQAQYNPNYNHQQAQYARPQQEQYGQPGGYYGGYNSGPPNYYQSNQPTGNSNQGYYGRASQEPGFEMQPPDRVYQNQTATPEVHGAKK